jgi:hypothetical protein
MASISAVAATPIQSEEMNPNQKAFMDKANQTVSLVVNKVKKIITDSFKMKYSKFVATHIDPWQLALSEMDERTSKFFKKMMDAINPSIENVPIITIFLQGVGKVVNDPQIHQKLVEGIALPFVKTMIVELDRFKPSIVDDVINSKILFQV